MHLGLDLGGSLGTYPNNWKTPIYSSVIATFLPPYLSVFPNNFDKSTPVHVQEIQM